MAAIACSVGGRCWARAGAAAVLAVAGAAAGVTTPAAAQETLSVDPAEVRPGDEVDLVGTGWCCEGDTGPVVDLGTGAEWGTAQVDAQGVLTADLVVPEEVAFGATELEACILDIDVGDCETVRIIVIDPDGRDDPGPDPTGGPPPTDPSGVGQPTRPASSDSPVPAGLLVAAVVLAVLASIVGLLWWRRGARRPRPRRPRRRPRVVARTEPGRSALRAPGGGPAVAVTASFDLGAGTSTIIERGPP